ncbi:MAG TPA: SDR family oxidoreductase [Solirubrobacterales bacterium]|nr:SDR family oxidoreductase [Solirubrobacterales bacterium]
MNRFTDKTAVVTGGAMGLGARISRRFADEGARVLIVDRDAEKGAATAAALPGSGHACVEADLGLRESIEPLVAALGELTDGVDALVNNAGISIHEPVEEADDEHWDLQFAINLRAPFLLSRALVPLMREREAAIVNVSSEVAFHPVSDGSTIYDITKAGLGGMTRSLAADLWRYGIRVNEMAPGGMVTEMHYAGADDPAAKKRELEEWELPEEWNVMRRLAKPEEVAPAVVFLASDDARFITGSTLHVDGGQGLG